MTLSFGCVWIGLASNLRNDVMRQLAPRLEYDAATRGARELPFAGCASPSLSLGREMALTDCSNPHRLRQFRCTSLKEGDAQPANGSSRAPRVAASYSSRGASWR